MTTNRVFEFNSQQKLAIEAVMAWYKGWQDCKHSKQVFFLAGYAGTGKTSLAMTIAELVGGMHKVVFIAPTGKAASRLRQKGCTAAKTMHNFIYRVAGEDENKEPIFIGKGALDEQPVLVIMDESSMVSQRDLELLQSHGIAILALGDTGQVPTVKAKQYFIKGREDFLLTDVERQGKESNIIRASFFIRQGKRLPVREYEDVRVREGKPTNEDIIRHCADDAVIICSRNSTREYMNKRARKLLGFNGDMPNIGEKVVCTFNQHTHRFMNGEQGIVLGYDALTRDELYDMEDDLDEIPQMQMIQLRSLTDGREIRVKFNPLSFNGNEEERAIARKGHGGFDYGNTLTVHKSQGSEWPWVLVIEEMLPAVPYEQMMYTAVTRAQNVLTVYRGK